MHRCNLNGSRISAIEILGWTDISQEQAIAGHMSQHAKTYANVIGSCIQGASAFNEEVKNGIYPPADNGWSMDEKELDKFMNLLEQQY